ncbi:hypothetical protein OI18_11285 [Flavihumibacter solisilvae]|uniref:O-antigen polymerase n=2 Tax=Flavihumibacter solisilvae TaxID=1349421 RepID=A0A0C1IW05_9BACT|nr:hypothetical protein OI18_11285 [Flavihumibacter solisilvae]
MSVFSKEIATRRLFGVDFDYFSYTFALVFFIFNLKRILYFQGTPWKLYGYLVFSSLISIVTLNMGYGGFLKQIIPILILYSVNFFIVGSGDWTNIFKLYVKFAYYSAIFGIIQFVASLGGIDLLNQTAGRLDSVAYEPSHYAALLVPAMVFAFFHYKEYKFYFNVMLVALILTLNLTGYLSFLFVISLAYINLVYFIFIIPLAYFLIFKVLIDFNENFNMRIVDTLAVFKGDVNVLNKQVRTNGTTVSLFSNLMVAKSNIENWHLLGSGVGGHEESYYRYFENSSFRHNWFFGLNAPSGHSLSIRILSELGIVGFVLYVYVLVKNLLLADSGICRNISLACLSHFVCKSFKLGGIIDYGTPFFFAMLIINGIQYRYNQNLKKKNDAN